MVTSRTPDRYQPLVEMAREMSLRTGGSPQVHFDSLLNLLRGPSRFRRGLWYLDRNREVAIILTGVTVASVVYLAL